LLIRRGRGVADVRGGEKEKELRVREEAANDIRLWRRKCVERLLRKCDFISVCFFCVYNRSTNKLT